MLVLVTLGRSSRSSHCYFADAPLLLLVFSLEVRIPYPVDSPSPAASGDASDD